MRTKRSLLSPLATAALCAVAVTSAGAQRVAAKATLRPAAPPTTVAVNAAILRQVAVYHFGSPRAVGMPTAVTLSDSVGKLVAAYRLPGGAERPMTVDVLNSDLVLTGETPSGLLTLVLYRQNDPEAADAWVGRWSLGEHQGELRGRSVR
jgi:hypothetical protein